MADENSFDDERRFLKFWIVAGVRAAVIVVLAIFPGRSLIAD